MIPELTLTGPPRERGRNHGEAIRTMMPDAIDRWLARLDEIGAPGDFIERLIADTGLLAAAEHQTPDLLDEVRGIAEGAAQPFETMLAWQFIDEAWWYLDELVGELPPLERCSAFAINQGGRGLAGQTQDLYRHLDGFQVMLRHVDDNGLEILMPSVSGLLGLNGVNSAGLAVCITTLSQLAHSPSGLSSGFIMPALLRCRSIDAALDLLRNTPIASGNSFTLADRDRSVVVEVSANDVTVADDGARVLRTNHPLCQAPVREYERFASSLERLDQLERTVRPDSTLDELTAMYATGAVCQSRTHDSPVISIGTMLFELGDDQTCHYGAGPLDEDALVTYRMTSRVERAD